MTTTPTTQTEYTIRHVPAYQDLVSIITMDKIEKLYFGKGNQCRCGCGGNYYYVDIEKGYNITKENHAYGLELIQKVLGMMTDGTHKVRSIDSYIFEITDKDGTFGNGSVYTLYLYNNKKALNVEFNMPTPS
jgi:hypothetical protein